VTKTLGDVDLAEVAGSFGQLLHAAGVPVTPERTGCFVRSIVLVRPTSLAEVYWTGRVTLLAGHEDFDIYDRVFAQVFRGMADVADHRGDANQPPPAHVRLGSDRRARSNGVTSLASPPAAATGPGIDSGKSNDVGAGQAVAMVSADERLRTKDFADWTAEELASLRSLIAELVVAAPIRRGRRHARRRPGERLDLRATLRRSHHTGGDPVERVLRRRLPRPRRLVLLADISGSMEPYARAYLHLLHGAVRATKAESFVFATRLTRLTRELRVSNPDQALRRAAAAAPDWSGGTRIGQAVRSFNDQYGRRGMARGAIVVIVSDGWELDEPAVLSEQMARLARLAHRVIWVNPRAANDHYQPLVRGMVASLPHIDVMLSGHSPAALVELLAAIADVESSHPARPRP
jgi:uncharacterized protein with von Willebrand factor type A (vWA) domain